MVNGFTMEVECSRQRGSRCGQVVGCWLSSGKMVGGMAKWTLYWGKMSKQQREVLITQHNILSAGNWLQADAIIHFCHSYMIMLVV